MHRLYALMFLLFCLSASSQQAAQHPMPFYDWGACPFEGCVYRNWKATRRVTVWTNRHRRHVAFTIEPGEWVRGLTGVVITTQPGVSKVLVRMTVGADHSVNVSPGDLLYTLQYAG